MVENKCKICGKVFMVYPCNLERRKTCSKKCKYKYLGQILSKQRKGKYSKGHKFQKGHGYIGGGSKKGKHNSPKTEFKKGHIPWTKGTIGIVKAWNKGLGSNNRTERMKEMGLPKYLNWRKQVFERDNYTCRICGKRGGKLVADHIKMWVLFPELRYSLDNGQTLCRKCSIEKTRKELKVYWKNQYTISKSFMVPIVGK
jgi:hypothetical protein